MNTFLIQGSTASDGDAARSVPAGSSARWLFALFPGTTARASLVSTLLASVVLIEGGFLVGYSIVAPKRAAVPARAGSPGNVPAAVGNAAAPPSQQNWGATLLGHPMSYYQQYTCYKFGPACPIALAIQSAENPRGGCEAYNYNSNGTLDWGYFQINSVHINRRGVNLRDLLDCRANIDFAYQLYQEEGFQPWSTFVTGRYRRFLDNSIPTNMPDPRPRPSLERTASIPTSTVTASGYTLACAIGRCTPAFP